MKLTTAANISLALVVMAWASMDCSVGAAMADPGPAVDPSKFFGEQHRVAMFWSIASLLFMALGAWLAGHAYTAAKIRSVLALVLCMAMVCWLSLMQP